MHPVFKSKVLGYGYLSIYIFIWVLNLVLNAYYLPQIPVQELVVKSGVFCTVFAILGLALWYNVNACKKSKSIISFISYHLAVAAAMVGVWFYASTLLVNLIYSDQALLVELNRQINPLLVLVGLSGYVILTLAYHLYISYIDLKDKHKIELELQQALTEVEVSMLRSQINPHFLFNSLNSISSLTMVDAERAQAMIVKLSEFLRYTVSHADTDFVSISKELNNINRYLDIETIRFGNRLQFSFDVASDAANRLLPSMLLQPLYENAIKHGVYESIEPVSIATIVQADSYAMKITIANNYSSDALMVKGAGVGLQNIARRLKLIYQNDKLLTIDKSEDGVFKISILIPN